jgi:hypothetical protein
MDRSPKKARGIIVAIGFKKVDLLAGEAAPSVTVSR